MLKRAVLVIMCLCIGIWGMEVVIASTNGSKELEQGRIFEYPITPKDEEWSNLGSVQAKIEACRIPQEILDEMTNEQLYQAIMEFPFLVDLFIAPSEQEGVESLERTCDAYRELLSRDNAKDFLMDKINGELNVQRNESTVRKQIQNDALVSLIFYQDKFEEEISIEEYTELMSLSTTMEIATTADATTDTLIVGGYVQTPNGTDVLYYVYTCPHDSDYHTEMANAIAEAYEVTLIEVGTCRYNCHLHAWYSTSQNNDKLIFDPAVYMTDGSYTKVLSGISTTSLSAQMGDIVFYGTNEDPSHSAILVSGISGGPIANRIVRSKWGQYGVYEHVVCHVPESYDTRNVSVWHR